jgi:hypothetical protein
VSNLRVAASASSSLPAWTSAPASLNAVSILRCGVAHTTGDIKQSKSKTQTKRIACFYPEAQKAQTLHKSHLRFLCLFVATRKR